MGLKILLLASLALVLPAAAMADSSATITVTGSVTAACHLGSPTATTVEVGTLANSSDGTLAPISPQSTTITASWCNTGSIIGISATPLVAQGFAGAPPAGFTKAVNYTASASGWTATPASFITAGNSSGTVSGTPVPGTQTTTDPVGQTITVSVSGFATPASAGRLVADPNYSGTITITLQTTAASSP